MIERNDEARGWVVGKITVRSDSDADPNNYCAYEIEIETDKGIIRFEGCHDSTPDIEIERI